MTIIELPYFGQINISKLEEYYATESSFNGRVIRLDLNFENRSITDDQAKNIKIFLESISTFDIQNRSSIDNDFNANGESSDYLSFYVDELNEEELGRIIDNRNEEKSKEEQLLRKLRLIRVGLYPDGKYGTDYFGVFDYSIDIDGEPCNQLLVVKTKSNGDLDHITWES